MLLVSSPSIAVMRSPGKIPALAAGEPSIGATILSDVMFHRHLKSNAAEFAAFLHLQVVELLCI